MKSLLPFFAFFFTISLWSQNSLDREFYLDSLFNETIPEKASYIRVVQNYETIQNEYWILQYYKSGELHMKGKSSNRNLLIEKGNYIYYYKNGFKNEELHYENGQKIGPYFSWYENGAKKTEGEFIKNTNDETSNYLFKLNQYWDDCSNQHVIDGNGNYIDEDKKFGATSSGSIVNGLKEGIWTGKCNISDSYFTEEYENGVLFFGTSFLSNKNYHYKTIFEKGLPKKGLIGFYNFANLTIQRTPLIGKLQLLFYVNATNKISDFYILQSNSKELEPIIIKLVNEYQQWELDTYRGIPIKTYYNFPINVYNRKSHH